MAQNSGQVAGCCVHGNGTSGNLLISLGARSFSRRTLLHRITVLGTGCCVHGNETWGNLLIKLETRLFSTSILMHGIFLGTGVT
jgi:hypothetical protein